MVPGRLIRDDTSGVRSRVVCKLSAYRSELVFVAHYNSLKQGLQHIGIQLVFLKKFLLIALPSRNEGMRTGIAGEMGQH